MKYVKRILWVSLMVLGLSHTTALQATPGAVSTRTVVVATTVVVVALALVPGTEAGPTACVACLSACYAAAFWQPWLAPMCPEACAAACLAPTP